VHEHPLRFVAQHPRAILMTVPLLTMVTVGVVGEAAAEFDKVPDY
jgi:hypothetical protein